MSSEAIARLRAQFEAELTSNPSLYHPIDIGRVRSEDWQVKRYLLDATHPKDQSKVDEAKAFTVLCEALRWKKSFGLHERTAQYFPKEFFVLSGSEVVGVDKEGRPIGWGIAKNHRTFKETTLLRSQFVANQMEVMDRLVGEGGCTTVTDASGSSMFNVDNDLQKFQTQLFSYYPGLFRAMYIVDMPWLLNTVMKLFVSWMDPKLAQVLKLIKAEQLPEYVDPEYIPVTTKGGKREGQKLPEGLATLEERYEHYGLDDKFVDHYYKTYKMERPSKV